MATVTDIAALAPPHTANAIALPIPNDEEHPAQHAPNIIELEDKNLLQEISKHPYSGSELSNPFDVAAARKWVTEVVLKLPRAPPASSRSRELAEVEITEIAVTYGADEKFSLRIYVPAVQNAGQDRSAALIMYHGGGFVHSSPVVDEDVAVFFASELRAVVINVDYRLAPENKFPVPLEDCWQALQWTVDHAEEYNINKSRIGLWGCSAGGNLAAAVAVRDATLHKESRLRHVSLVVPAICHPDVYPIELQSPESSVNKFEAGQGQFAIKAILYMYAGDNGTDPNVSVLTAEIPPNHVPVHVAVAGRDIFRDEGIAYALRLRNKGVDSQLQIIPGVPHGISFPPTTHVARQFFRDQARILDYALNFSS